MLVCAWASLAATPRRLVINGSRVAEPETPTVPVRLRGFNFWVAHNRPLEVQDKAVAKLLPGTNLARLVMVHWQDVTRPSQPDCYSPNATGGYLTPECLKMFDDTVAWITGEGIWAVITGRAKAGDKGAVLSNPTLSAQMVAMWSFLAARYSKVSGIAGYEVMSEPRILDASVIHAFHVSACNAVWAADPRAACLIGPGQFYNRYALDEQYIVPGNVIYAGNYLSPNPFITGKLKVAYPSPPGTTVRCADLLEKKDWSACPGGDENAQVSFNKALLETLAAPLSAFQSKFNVPVWSDQWGLHESVGGGNPSISAYMTDALDIFEKGGFLWTQWIWRDINGNSCDGFNIICQPTACGPWELHPQMYDPLSKYLGGAGGVPTPIVPPASGLCACISDAEAICTASLQNASACKSCIWKHHDELVAQGCDWNDHTSIINGVCDSRSTSCRTADPRCAA